MESGIERPDTAEKRRGEDLREPGAGSVICVAAMSSETKAIVFLSSSILAFASKPWPIEQAALADWAVWAMLGDAGN